MDSSLTNLQFSSRTVFKNSLQRLDIFSTTLLFTSVWKSNRSMCCQLLPSSANRFQYYEESWRKELIPDREATADLDENKPLRLGHTGTEWWCPGRRKFWSEALSAVSCWWGRRRWRAPGPLCCPSWQRERRGWCWWHWRRLSGRRLREERSLSRLCYSYLLERSFLDFQIQTRNFRFRVLWLEELRIKNLCFLPLLPPLAPSLFGSFGISGLVSHQKRLHSLTFQGQRPWNLELISLDLKRLRLEARLQAYDLGWKRRAELETKVHFSTLRISPSIYLRNPNECENRRLR